MLKVLGWSREEAMLALPDLYEALASEIVRAMERLGRPISHGRETKAGQQRTLDETTEL